VLDNATGEILAYLGSHDFEDEPGLGQNDGVLMRRQPGSSLKPFVYALAMERLGFTAATMIPDVETHFVTSGGDFSPNNYDARFHGPVLLREALASSYNVPAVRTAAALGEANVLAELRELGFATLDRSADDYGVALALGDGETRLLDLANAYATIARRGALLPVRALRAGTLAGGGPAPLPEASARQVMDPSVALVLADVLSDDRARAPSFGRSGPLDLPFPVAAKTGTSKGYRDNIAVGFTREVTVAVWVGNFDGSPMEGSERRLRRRPLVSRRDARRTGALPRGFAGPAPRATGTLRGPRRPGRRAAPHGDRGDMPPVRQDPWTALPAFSGGDLPRRGERRERPPPPSATCTSASASIAGTASAPARRARPA
jgi:penicillin-binding protein 1C